MLSDSIPMDLILEILSRLPAKSIARKDDDEVPVICNPKTGRYETLPYINRKTLQRVEIQGFGEYRDTSRPNYPMRVDVFADHVEDLNAKDPILLKSSIYAPYVYTEESEEEESEIDECSFPRFSGDADELRPKYVIVCFVVRYEKFKFIYPASFCELINYNGKLGVIYYDDLSDDAIELRVWVLEDVEKQEWSKYSYTLRGDKLFRHYASEVGVISTGEIVLSMAEYTSKQPFYIYYFKPERNTIRRVEIQGLGEYHKPSKNPGKVYVFIDDCSRFYPSADHAEDLNVDDPKLLNSSIYSPYVKTEESEK
ncbi:hypothetical protein Bca4012_065078 [Brassica carinata]